MKKKSKNYSQNFKMPHLFREDLEEIENVLKELTIREYKVETKDFEYKTVQEIPISNDPVNDFHIHAYDPYISLDLNNFSARIYASDDDIKTIGIVKKITDIISKRERKSLWYLSNLSTWLAPIFFIVPPQIWAKLDEKKIQPNKIWLVILAIVFVLSVIWWTIGYLASLKKYSLIEFTYKKNKTNFLTRNKDQIVVGIIVAIISIITTLLFQKLFK